MKTIDELLSSVAQNLNAAPKESFPKVHKKAEPPKADASLLNKEADVPKIKPEQNIKHELLSLSLAKELAQAAELAADILGVKAVIAIMNEGANLILLHAMDDSYIASTDIARDKAYTAAALKMPTYKALEMSRGGELDGLSNTNGLMLLGGGEPLMINGRLYGSVGISGGTKDQDITLAKVAAKIFEIKMK